MKILQKVKKLHWAHCLDAHFKKELSAIESQSKVSKRNLSKKQKKALLEYYEKFGLKVDFRWHEYLYSVTGTFDVRCLPENLYHCQIEPLCTRASEDFEDKAYMEKLLPNVKMTDNYYKRINGYYFDNEGHLIDETELLNGLSTINEEVVVKPSILSGGAEPLN